MFNGLPARQGIYLNEGDTEKFSLRFEFYEINHFARLLDLTLYMVIQFPWLLFYQIVDYNHWTHLDWKTDHDSMTGYFVSDYTSGAGHNTQKRDITQWLNN